MATDPSSLLSAETLRCELACIPNPDSFAGSCLREDGIVFRPCQECSIRVERTAFAVHQLRHACLSGSGVPCPQSIIAVTKDSIVYTECCKPSGGAVKLGQLRVGGARERIDGAATK